MSSPPDDERLLDALLADARNAPKPEDLQRVEHRLRDWLEPSAVLPLAQTSTRFLRSSNVLKPLLVVVIGMGIMAHVYLRDASTPAGSSSPATVSLGAPPEVPAPPAALAVPVAGSVSVADLPDVPERIVAHPASPTATTLRAPSSTVSTREGSSVQTKTPTVAADEESEASFLRRTRAALADDPALALRMTDEHASRYRQGVLAQEREVIAIDALVRIGRRDEARARASAFRVRYPSSAHASRVDALVGKGEP